MNGLFGIRFAPLNIPLNRRLQTLCILVCIFEFIYMPTIYALLLWLSLFTPMWIVTLTYCIFWYLDRGQERRGGRRLKWIRKLPTWNYMKDYFPFKLIRTEPISADRNYIFGIHPHGIFSFNAIMTFVNDNGDFPKLFPGLTPYLLTLDQNFRFPIHRDIVMAIGACSVSKESINYLLQNNSQGTVLCIVVGGAAEAMDAYPGQMVLTLKHRKGFCRAALHNGASLVPVLQFGENECYNQRRAENGGWLHKFQQNFLKTTGVAFPIIKGRGIFQYNFGILPYRNPLHTVVGRPIHVDQIVNPSQKQVDELHQKYCESLKNLYQEYNSKYGKPDVELIFT